MKKRVLIIITACMFLMGCGSSNQMQGPLPSVESGVNQAGSSEDGTGGGYESGIEGNTNDVDAPSSGGYSEGGGAGASPDSSDDSYYDNDYDRSYSGTSGGGPSGARSSGGSDYDSNSDESVTPASSANSQNVVDTNDLNAENDSEDDSDSVNTDGDSESTGDVSDGEDNSATDLSDAESADADKNNSNSGNSSDNKDKDNSGNNSNSGNCSSDNAAEDATKEQTTSGYGRIFFIGDSRTVDMFDGGVDEIYDYNAGGIRVFAKDGCHCAYMQDVTGKYAGEFDTIVSWLGCNDNNDAALYQQVYENLISQGKNVVICTVGPTADESLSGDFDVANYPNEKMIAFNQSMVSWANTHGVKVIDTYTFVKGNIEISPDGIHYNPKPTTAIWNYILANL